MPVSTGKLERAMNSLTVGTVQAMDRKKRDRLIEGLAEREEQFKIEVSGRGEEFPEWTKVELTFESVFVDGTGNRDSEFDRPVFTYGYYVPVGGPVGLDACITEWNVNDRSETTGCVMWIGARATDVARKFKAEIHAVFQGYGMPPDPYGDISDTN
jgi:hypothetical protein